MLNAISPLDGRYADKTRELAAFFSEEALIRYRVVVEIRYFLALARLPLPQLQAFPQSAHNELHSILSEFGPQQAGRVKDIERETNHDVKAVEYFLKEEFERLGLSQWKEFIHFGLTSQDINNTAVPLLVKEAIKDVYAPWLQRLRTELELLADQFSEIPMLARTHGQPASPTLLGKELRVFLERLSNQVKLLEDIPDTAKFGGATGNFNAHSVAYPSINWIQFANDFVRNDLGLERCQFTTQIEHYDHLAALFHALLRINTILIDLCRDLWTYISMEYFRQKVVAHEVGSSAMPHKVNPIDFENAEGNLGLANALFGHLAEKLPVSRLQRDLTDSTVIRNIGVPIAHTLIALKSIHKGLGKLVLNETALRKDLESHWSVVAEAIQTILRREGYPQPYEALKALTRGSTHIDKESITGFINQLEVSAEVREELLRISPLNYVGITPK